MSNKTTQKTPLLSALWNNSIKDFFAKGSSENVLASVYPFSQLSTAEQNSLMEIIHERRYKAGEFVFCQGDPGIGIYLIQSGEITIGIKTSGNEHTAIADFTEGEFFGELALLDGDERSASAIAKTDSVIYILFKNDFEDFVKRQPKAGITLLGGLTKIIIARMRNMNKEYSALLEKFHSNTAEGENNQ